MGKFNPMTVVRTVFMAMAMLVVLSFSVPSRAMADDSVGDFFSTLRPPEIKFPKIEIVPFWTDDLKRARGAYADGDFPQAMEYFRRSSEDGNIVADWYLGHIFRLGQGTPVDPATAYSYYNRVAENFDPDEPDKNRLRIAVDAQLRVADYLRTGIKSAKLTANPQLAARTYLRIATSYAHPRALYGLGTMSIEGEGMTKNPAQGLKWLNAAVRKHSPDAAAYLGELYHTGTYVRQDDTRALMWYTIASESALKTENPQIFSRLANLRSAATEEVRLEAKARARVWDEQNPVRAGE
jgi:uncharacterized protein